MICLGIDLGTSAVKILAVSEKGKVLSSVSEEYPVFYPHPGWSEQNPSDWWNGVCRGLERLSESIDMSDVAGIGVAGQMHGLVVLDSSGEVIRPAILWNDGRTDKETDYLNNEVGKDVLSSETGNIAFAGFTAPKILWMKENEPGNFKRIKKIMLPKDYIVYMLTGAHTCDYSDASGMLLLDVKNKRWSEKMLEICSVDEGMMPELHESNDTVGTVKEDVAAKLGLGDNVRVVAGAGDNAAAAIGTGTVGKDKCNISLGTSGTIFISSEKFGVDSFNSLHSFCHADGNYHLMGCMLSAASCNKWFMEEILGDKDYAGIQSGITDDMLGRNHVYFLPYLMGERSPINDTNARGTFTGLTADTGKTDMLQSVLEGVAFAIRDSFEVAASLGLDIKSSTICGGGAKSPLWKKIMADVLNIRIDTVESEEGPGFGGAVLAMVGCGEYESVTEACSKLIKITDSVYPDSEIAGRYADRYEKFRKIYPAMKKLFEEIK